MRNNSQSKLSGSRTPEPSTALNMSGVIDAVLEVGRQRKALLAQLRAALQSGNDSGALELARQLCGIQHEESHRTNPRLN
jgi:hypothetical protein